jgi:PPE-repeat protein
MDFGALPPEINSARMYAGPGAGSMLAAAEGWAGLAADLQSTATAYQSVISRLTGPWQGPASASMAAAVAPYVTWLEATAAQAGLAATQARAAAGAHAAAFAMTVPPPVIAANRAQLAALVATNVLGQNTPAIMATEAHYVEMWAQDAVAMYGYAADSAAVTRTVTPFNPPPQTTNPAGPAGQAGAVARATATSAGAGTQTTLSQAMSAMPTTLQGLAAPATATSATSPSSALAGLTNTASGTTTTGSLIDPNSNFWNTISSSGAFNPGQVLDAVLPGLIVPPSGAAIPGISGGFGGLAPVAVPAAAGLGSGGWGLPGVAGLGGAGSAVSAGVGQAASVGPISVPPSWTAAAPPVTPVAATNIGGLGTMVQNGAPGVPGMPLGAMGPHSLANAAPRYGFRPAVVSRPPAAG